MNVINNNNNTKFTKDQETAINGIIDFIATPFNPAKYIIGLSGAGGTGKTYITKYIINNCKYSNSVIKCASSTHKACRVFSQAIGGKIVDTIQSVFGLRLDLKLEDFNPKNPQFNPMAAPKLDNIKLLIIDEASMIPAKLVTYINKECKTKTIKILYIGDEYQLSPVNERKSIAFNTCTTLYKLKEIVRQKENNPINILTKLLREDIENKSYNFISYIHNNINAINYNENNEGFSICNHNTFMNIINTRFTDKEYTKNIDMYRIIAYTNNCVTGYNNYVRNNIIKNSNKTIINKHDLIMSYRTIVNEFMETILNNSEEYIINDIVNYVDDKYGFIGFLIKFQLIHGGLITKPLFVIDHKDKQTIINYCSVLGELINKAKNSTGGTRVSKWKEYYNFKKKYILATNVIDRFGNIVYDRDIDYGFSITSHKSQGSTYNTVFVDLNNMIYDKNNNIYTNADDLLRRLYVACSRAQKELILCYK